MKLRIFLPATDALEAGAELAWMLLDARGNLLREATSTVAQMPRASDVETVLPAERVLFARLKLPKVSPATIRELLPYAVEDRLLADPAHIHAVAGATNERGETLVAVVDREWLRDKLETLARAGQRATRAWSESSLLAGGHGDWHVVLGPARGMLVDDEGVSATFDRGAGFPLAVRIALDEAAARGDRPSSIRVHTDSGEALPDLARWSAEGGTAFAPGSRWEILARGQPAAASINLLEGELAPSSGRKMALPRGAVALVAVIVTLQALFSGLAAMRLGDERANLERRREAIFRAAFPEAKVVVDPDLQMARNLADLKRARGLAAGDDFLAQMTRAANGRDTVKSIEYANGKLVTR
ncbi:MAG: type II secretion system protein GspL [Usitatibacter sp.]